MFKSTPFYIEVQNSVYSEKVMQKKMNLYEEFFQSKEWHRFEWQPQEKKFFPYIVLLSQEKYKIDTSNVQVFQFKDINEFLSSLSKNKKSS